MSVRPATVVALFLAVLALVAAGCGDDEPSGPSGSEQAQESEPGGSEEGESEEEREREEQEAREASGQDCSEVGDIDAEPKNQPPSDLTVLEGAHVYESEGPFGKTERFFAAVDGDSEEMVAKRDAAAEALVANGYKLLGSDQEEGAEAEAHLEGDEHTVDIQVINLCAGKLRIRYTVS